MTAVRIFSEGAVSRIVLCRPEAKNVLDPPTWRAMLEAILSACNDSETNSVLIEAEGSVFCAGLDLAASLDSATAEDTQALERLLSFGLASPKPIVAGIQGAALGAGAILAANAHVAVASQGTSFAFTEIRTGLWPFVGWDAIERALGRRRALELTLTGRVFSVQDALGWGLIHEITQPSELEDRAFATASMLAAAPSGAVKAALNWMREPADPARSFLSRLRSPEAREGMAAFLEKRRPAWPQEE